MKSQNEAILHFMKCGRVLTPLAALRLFRCMRLAARIHELRGRGHPIHCGSKYVGGKRYGCYWMGQAGDRTT
jgi:hypothetical protein